MNRKDLKQEYFEWLCHFVKLNNHKKLLFLLFSIDFTYDLPMDGNRYEDGIDLRYRFADEKGYPQRYAAHWLDDVPCSVLEMMVALCLRIEEHITGNPDDGDKTSEWFKDMLKTSGLYNVADDRYSERTSMAIIQDILTRNYARNGDGGLFKLRHTRQDLRHVEIWYQAMWYIDEKLNIK